MDAHRGAFAGGGDGFDGELLLGLDADDAGLGAHGLHRKLHAPDQLSGLFLHHDRVLVQQRLALRAVGDHRVRLGRQFDVGGKPPAARADHAGLFHFVGQSHKS